MCLESYIILKDREVIMKKILVICILGLILLSGCISPKTDAFLLGAGLGAGATYYFLNGGKIDGIGKNSFQGTSQQSIADTSIPSELEWYYFNPDLQEQIFLNQKQSQIPFN